MSLNCDCLELVGNSKVQKNCEKIMLTVMPMFMDQSTCIYFWCQNTAVVL